jgi:hypothetical protein
MNKIVGIFNNLIGSVTEFFVETLPPLLWEHKMWVIALLPVAGVYALYKFLWD